MRSCARGARAAAFAKKMLTADLLLLYLAPPPALRRRHCIRVMNVCRLRLLVLFRPIAGGACVPVLANHNQSA
jgi:hypothetical protein